MDVGGVMGGVGGLWGGEGCCEGSVLVITHPGCSLARPSLV